MGQQGTQGDFVGMRRVHHVDVAEVLGQVEVLRHAELGLHYDDVRTLVLDFLQQPGQFLDPLGETQADVEDIRLLRHDRCRQADDCDLQPLSRVRILYGSVIRLWLGSGASL